MDYVVSFLIGGLVCAAVQILLDRTKLMPGRVMVLLVCTGAVLGFCGLYEPFKEFAKSGASVPLLGFGNTLWQGVKDAVDENGFIGIFMGGFKASAVGISAAGMMEETLKNFSVKTYRKTVEAIRKARLIDIYSVENSGVAAQDLLAKLLYLGLPCRYFSDSYYQRISAGSLTDEDVAVGISYSGASKDTVDAMRTAKRSGAVTIVITNFRDSPICRYADILICTSQEQFIYGNAIYSRMTQLLIVDMIYMGIIASDYEHYVGLLDQGEKIVRERAYPYGAEKRKKKKP